MSSESLAPDELTVQTNLLGDVAYIQDDPDSPDAAWLEAVDRSLDTTFRCKFSEPWGDLKTGAGLQGFRIYVRKTDNTPAGNPTMKVDLYESGAFVSQLTASEAVSSTTGVVYSYTWNASLLTGIEGSDVELYILTTAT